MKKRKLKMQETASGKLVGVSSGENFGGGRQSKRVAQELKQKTEHK